MATAVISATEGMHYLHHILPFFNVNIATLLLLALFLGLTISGISESNCSLGNIYFHLISMVLLVIFVEFLFHRNGFSILSRKLEFTYKSGDS